MPTSQEIASFRLFLKKGSLFVAPFLLYAALIVVIDPFNYFGLSGLSGLSQVFDREVKRKTAGILHLPLWKSIDYLRDPKPNLMLGDSRMALVAASMVEEFTGEPYYNFSYGGGTIPELVDTFWLADEEVELQRVFIGLSFVNFNRFQSMNRFIESRAMIDNPLLYLTNREVAKAAFYLVAGRLRGEGVSLGKPDMDLDAFWKYQLGDAIAAHYGRFVYPPEHLEALRRIAEHCAENGIELTFVIPPSHVEMQAKIDEFGHRELAERFGRDLRGLGRVLDFDFPNEFTRDRANFTDPVHFRDDLSVMIMEQMFSDSPDPALTRF